MAAANRKVLDQILHEAWDHAQRGVPFLAVFDLDSTLYDLTLRVSAIVDEFRADREAQLAFPELCAALESVQILPTDWGLDRPLARAGIATDSEFFQRLEAFWAERFFFDAYLAHDEPLPGAVTYVQELHQVGAHIMYLTGRDVARMGKGTLASLREHRFPSDGPAVDVRLKPDQRLDDAQFKLDVLRVSSQSYPRIWLFENEPVNLNLVARELPGVNLVFIDSTHSGREQLAGNLETIRHFEVDLAAFRSLTGQMKT